MGDLTAALADIDKGLRKFGRSVLLDALRPGLNPDRTRSLLGESGLPASEQVEALYAWRDGTETAGIGSLDDIHFFPGFYLLSLDDAVANYRAFVADRRWTQGWLPIFANGGGDFYVTDLSGEMSGVVRHFRIEESEHPVEFLTIGNMLATIAAGYERGVFFVDGSGYLEMDDLAFASVAADLNPGVPWWVD
jgi:cell wall assembly regulator SMI1